MLSVWSAFYVLRTLGDDLGRGSRAARVAGDGGEEVVALQACHPRFFATHRYIVYARLARVTLPNGRAVPPG